MREKKEMNLEQLTMGVCYYPEHWDASMWKDDLLRMQDNGISVIRIGEFAWTVFEPKEGEFKFDFFAANNNVLRVQVFNSHARTVFNVFAVVSLRTGHRRYVPNLDHDILGRGHAGQSCKSGHYRQF